MRTVYALGAVALGLAGCNDAAGPSRTALTDLTVRVTVRDSAGLPVAGSATWLGVQRKDALYCDGRCPVNFQLTDSLGMAELRLDSLDQAQVDTVRVYAQAVRCDRPPSTGANLTLKGLPPHSSATLDQTLTLPVSGPPAAGEAGAACAVGHDAFWGPGTWGLWLTLDTPAGSSFTGRWTTIYTWTRLGDEGRLYGTQWDDRVVLVLTNEHTESWRACRELRLYTTVQADGTWAPLTILRDDGCLTSAYPLRLIQEPVRGRSVFR